MLRVALSNGDWSLEYESENGTTVVDDARIQNTAVELDGSTVSRAVVAAESRDLGINLESSTGTGTLSRYSKSQLSLNHCCLWFWT